MYRVFSSLYLLFHFKNEIGRFFESANVINTPNYQTMPHQRPSTAGASRRSNPTHSSKSKKKRPSTAGRWGYGLGSDKAKTSNRNKLGKGVSIPVSSSAGRRRRRRRPTSSSSTANNISRPQFEQEHMGRKQRQPDPTYTVKYLGISRGEIGILSRQLKISKQTRSGPLHRVPSNRGPHRAPRYRLDPDIVTTSLREIYAHNNNKHRPSTAPSIRPETLDTDDLDNGVTPCPDLYDSWKIPFTKQPHLLSSGSRPSSSMGVRNILLSRSTDMLSPLQRPTTSTGMRRRKGMQQQQPQQEEQQLQEGFQLYDRDGSDGAATKSVARPSTAPANAVRRQKSKQQQEEIKKNATTETTAETVSTASTATASTATTITTSTTTELSTTPTPTQPAAPIEAQNSIELTIPTQHDEMLAEQLRLLHIQEEHMKRKARSEEKRRRQREQDLARGQTFQPTSEEEAPYCVHKRIRGWKLTSPAKLWGDVKSRNWQSKQKLTMIKSDLENSSILDVDSSGTRPAMATDHPYQSGSGGGNGATTFGGNGGRDGRDGGGGGGAPRPSPIRPATSERIRLMRRRREEDIRKTRERLMKGRGIRQTFRSGHRWDSGHPEIPPQNTHEHRALSSSVAEVQTMVGKTTTNVENTIDGDEVFEIEGGDAYYYADDMNMIDNEGSLVDDGSQEEWGEENNSSLQAAATMEPFLMQLLSRK